VAETIMLSRDKQKELLLLKLKVSI